MMKIYERWSWGPGLNMQKISCPSMSLNFNSARSLQWPSSHCWSNPVRCWLDGRILWDNETTTLPPFRWHKWQEQSTWQNARNASKPETHDQRSKGNAVCILLHMFFLLFICFHSPCHANQFLLQRHWKIISLISGSFKPEGLMDVMSSRSL